MRSSDACLHAPGGPIHRDTVIRAVQALYVRGWQVLRQPVILHVGVLYVWVVRILRRYGHSILCSRPACGVGGCGSRSSCMWVSCVCGWSGSSGDAVIQYSAGILHAGSSCMWVSWGCEWCGISGDAVIQYYAGIPRAGFSDSWGSGPACRRLYV